MSIAGFKSSNHPQQTAKRGASDEVDDRETHPENFAPLMQRFGFTLDVAAAPHNAKTPRYFTREDDGLSQPWSGRVWCNPPYSDCGAWVRKAWLEWQGYWPGNRPSGTVIDRDRPGSPLRVEFLPGRMRFVRPGWTPGPKGDRPPFGCCLLIWEAAA